MYKLSQTGERHGGWLPPWPALLLTALALAAYLLPGSAPELWVYDRSAIEQGELWRLITGHWVHSHPEHAFWDIGALALLTILFARCLGRALFYLLLAGTLGVDLWLWWIDSELFYYCGLSGILNSLLAAGLVQLWRETRHPAVWLAGLGAVAKICLEIAGGQPLVTQAGWPGVPEVHAVGFLCGLALTIPWGPVRDQATCWGSSVRPSPRGSPR